MVPRTVPQNGRPGRQPAKTPLDRAAGARPRPTPRRDDRSDAIAIHDVRFTYPGRTEPILDEFNLVVPAGESLAVVGENGAGKTTLVKLLCGLYEPDHGQITLDGRSDPIALRERVGVIFQDFVRYELPLRENVAFGSLHTSPTDDDLEQALRDAGAPDLLSRLPHGWDTILAKGYVGGTDLSGGQWQKVALARALVTIRGGASVLVLDEPTAHLDVRSERELFDRILDLTAGVTTILISHRLSSVRHADRIVAIKGGRIIEDGSHEGLIAADGFYARMFSLQGGVYA